MPTSSQLATMAAAITPPATPSLTTEGDSHDDLPGAEEREATHTETACEMGAAPHDCSSMFNCCDCGGNNCGCRYCWSCNACDTCR